MCTQQLADQSTSQTGDRDTKQSQPWHVSRAVRHVEPEHTLYSLWNLRLLSVRTSNPTEMVVVGLIVYHETCLVYTTAHSVARKHGCAYPEGTSRACSRWPVCVWCWNVLVSRVAVCCWCVWQPLKGCRVKCPYEPPKTESGPRILEADEFFVCLWPWDIREEFT